MSRSKAASWLLLILSVALVLWIRVLPRSVATTAQRENSPYTSLGEDGKEHAYLGDYDSYLWLRHARNLLRTGSPCDAIVDNLCRDTLTNAPVGASSIYAGSLHVFAIAGLHRVVTMFAPKFPLEATSFYVPVIVGCLGVLPAFFIARRLAGSVVAGPFAALLTALLPNVIARTIGSDNDIWNVVLPLYGLWALIAAVSARRWQGRLSMAALSAGFIALQAWAWRGWLFSYAVLALGLVGLMLVRAIRSIRRHGSLRIWRQHEAAHIAILALVFYVVAGLLTSLADRDARYLMIPVRTIAAIVSTSSSAPATGSDGDIEWPSVFNGGGSVAELRPMALQNTANAMGHTLLVCALTGLLLLFLPARWERRHTVLFVAATVWYWVCVSAIEPGRLAAIAILAAPLAVALLLGGDANEEDAGRVLAAFSLAAWFLGAVYAGYNGARYLLLLAPPFGICCAVLAGRLRVAVIHLAHDSPRWYRAAVSVVLAVVFALAFVHPATWAYSVASRLPAMHDAWWETLVHVRQNSSPDAIVHTMWDAGHWVKYIAERRVSNDGSSLATHIPFWMARAFAAPTEKESLGILRMLSCGSDATPLPEGSQGAYSKLLATVRDPATAYRLLNDIIVLDKNPAAAYLAAHGLTQQARDEVLQSSHCSPPDSYLVATSAMTARRQSWLSLGLRSPRQPYAPAVSSPPAAPEMFTTGDRASDVAFLPQWIPCTAVEGTTALNCRIQNPIGSGAPALSAFEYDPGTPQDGRLRSRLGGASDAVALPAAVVIAGESEIHTVTFPDSVLAGIGVLVDARNQRILLGAPSFLGSTFLRLMYLDERYSPHFRPFVERRAASERVVTWRIQWRDDQGRGR